MSGNVTKEGIKADLEWMKRVGIGGFQNFDAGAEHAAGRREAARLHDAGVEGRVPVRGDAGRPAGPRDGDRRLAGMERERRPVGHAGPGDEEVRVERDAASRADGRSPAALPKPPSTTGPFQNAPLVDVRGFGGQAQREPPPPEFYADTRRRRLSRAGERSCRWRAAAEGDLERRHVRRRRPDRRRPREGHAAAVAPVGRDGRGSSSSSPQAADRFAALTFVASGGGRAAVARRRPPRTTSSRRATTAAVPDGDADSARRRGAAHRLVPAGDRPLLPR